MFTMTIEQLKYTIRTSKNSELKMKCIKELRRRIKVYKSVKAA